MQLNLVVFPVILHAGEISASPRSGTSGGKADVRSHQQHVVPFEGQRVAAARRCFFRCRRVPKSRCAVPSALPPYCFDIAFPCEHGGESVHCPARQHRAVLQQMIGRRSRLGGSDIGLLTAKSALWSAPAVPPWVKFTTGRRLGRGRLRRQCSACQARRIGPKARAARRLRRRSRPGPGARSAADKSESRRARPEPRPRGCRPGPFFAASSSASSVAARTHGLHYHGLRHHVQAPARPRGCWCGCAPCRIRGRSPAEAPRRSAPARPR